MPRDLPVYVPGRTVAGAAKLSANELPFDPLPSVREAVADAARLLNRYPDHLAVAVREAVADHVGVASDHVAVGCGSVGLVQQLCLAYARPGDHVAFAWRSFEAYPVMTAVAGAEALLTPLRREAVDLDRLQVSERTTLVLLANPNNPTGTAFGCDEMERFLDRVPAGCLVVVDEAYREFVTRTDVTVPPPLPNVAVLRTFSKAYGLAALRIGYLVGAPEVVEAVDRVLIPFAVNRLAQAAALASLAAEAEDELRERVAAVVAERRRVRRALFDRGYPTPDSQANFVWLPHLDVEVDGVVTRPFPEGMRVTIGTPQENDRFLDGLPPVADPGHGRRLGAVLDRIDDVRARLRALAASPRAGLTEPDPGATERWEEGQVWAHMGEFGSYWLAELDRVLRADGTPFGRTKRDPGRIAAVEHGRGVYRSVHLGHAEAALDRLAALVSSLTAEDWGRHGVHPTLGRMDVPRILDEFLVGHFEEHADQLEKLDAG